MISYFDTDIFHYRSALPVVRQYTFVQVCRSSQCGTLLYQCGTLTYKLLTINLLLIIHNAICDAQNHTKKLGYENECNNLIKTVMKLLFSIVESKHFAVLQSDANEFLDF